MPDILAQSPPLPSAPGPASPGAQPPAAPTAGNTAGKRQIGGMAVRLGAELDQALKLLAQVIPQMAPWVEKTVDELRIQIGNALNSGAVPTSPAPMDNERFPGGGSNL